MNGLPGIPQETPVESYYFIAIVGLSVLFYVFYIMWKFGCFERENNGRV